MFQDLHWEDMPSRSLDGVLKMEPHIGWLLTHGIKIGEITDSSELKEEITNVGLKDKLLQAFQQSRPL